MKPTGFTGATALDEGQVPTIAVPFQYPDDEGHAADDSDVPCHDHATMIAIIGQRLQARRKKGLIVASLLLQWRAGLFPEIKSLSALATKYGLHKQTLYQAQRLRYRDNFGIDVRTPEAKANIKKSHRDRPKNGVARQKLVKAGETSTIETGAANPLKGAHEVNQDERGPRE